jgi:hypothetical protein
MERNEFAILPKKASVPEVPDLVGLPERPAEVFSGECKEYRTFLEPLLCGENAKDIDGTALLTEE